MNLKSINLEYSSIQYKKCQSYYYTTGAVATAAMRGSLIHYEWWKVIETKANVKWNAYVIRMVS